MESTGLEPSNRAHFALVSGLSLLRVKPEIDVYKPVYAEISLSERAEPLNKCDEVITEVMRIAAEREVTLPERRPSPYWNPDTEYHPLEVFGTLVQFVDYHKINLPATTLPPEADVKRYIDTIMSMTGRATIPEQFRILLDISKNDLLGAANIGVLASRIMARGLDTRAYPHIPSGATEMHAWNDKIAQFELQPSVEKNDGPGDTYYFWTHLFGALYFKEFDGFGKRIYRSSFQNGTEIMAKARQWIARSPINSGHSEASLMGRQLATNLYRNVPSKEVARISKLVREFVIG